MTRSRAIFRYCCDCSDNRYSVRQTCPFEDCAIWKGRNGNRPTGFQPAKVIRKYCLYCMNGMEDEVRKCPARECFFYPYRLGRKQTPDQG